MTLIRPEPNRTNARQCCRCDAWLRLTQYICVKCGHTVQSSNGKDCKGK